MLAIQFLSLFYFLAPRENKKRKEIMREHLFLCLYIFWYHAASEWTRNDCGVARK